MIGATSIAIDLPILPRPSTVYQTRQPLKHADHDLAVNFTKTNESKKRFLIISLKSPHVKIVA